VGQLRKLDVTGDTKHEWDASKPDEVAVAEEVFQLYRAQGYAAARMENDRAGEIIREFDPAAEVIIFVPQLQGG
jgi:hypothetical protein